MSRVVVSGNTYPQRDALRALGGVWDAEAKRWVIDIAHHPWNTMRGRSSIDSALRRLEQAGCQVEYEQ